MAFLSLMITLGSFLSILYTLPYANFEWKQKNKKGAMILYIMTLFSFITSMIQFLF